MKKKVLFSIALAGLMLGSCSKDAIDNGGNGASWNENGTGYINLAINLPTTTSASRALSFDDGEGYEYAVEDATLMLFTLATASTDENEAKLHSVYDMSTNFRDDENQSNQITQTSGIVQEIKEVEGSDKILALVVLNRNGLFTIEDNLLNIGGTKYGALPNGTTLKFDALNTTLAATESQKPWISATGFFLMSNAPLFDKPGSTTEMVTGGQTTTLVEIDRNNIAASISEAAEKTAADIFVERAQAKVEIQATGNNNGFEITDWDNAKNYKLYITKWGIDNYNNHSRLTRKFNKDWAEYENASNSPKYYRFVDAEQVDTSIKLYRTFWGEDVNYTTGSPITPALVSIEDKDKGVPNLDVTFGKCAYCFENTVSEVPAKGTDLTRVILQTVLKDTESNAKDFFTVNTDEKTIYLNDATENSSSIQARIKQHVLNDPGVAAAVEAEGKTPIQKNELTFAFTKNGLDKSGILNNRDNFTVTYNPTNTIIQNAINNSLYSVGNGSEVTNKINIDYHKGGETYYQVFIRHFDDDECPWTEGVDQAQSANNYLGRYGVLRNSWYVINVNSINNIGSSTYPVVPTDPVDEEEFFLTVKINIMPWAKRTQDVDL